MSSDDVEPRNRGDDRDRIVWRRHPADLARFVTSATILVVLLLLAALVPEGLTNLSSDIVDLVARIPIALRKFFGGLTQALVFIIPFAAVGWAWRRRNRRLFLVMMSAAVFGAVVMAMLNGWLERATPPQPSNAVVGDLFYFGADFPSTAYIAGLTAGVSAVSPVLTKAWQRACWIGVSMAALLRVASAVEVPVNASVAIALGAAAGSCIVLLTGAPFYRVGLDSIRAIGRRAGLEFASVTARAGQELDADRPLFSLPSFRGPRGRLFDAETTDGQPVFIRLTGREDRNGEVLYRIWRSLRVKEVGQGTSDLDPTSQVRVESLATYRALDAGANVPAVLGFASSEDGDAFIALDRVGGTPLDELTPDDITDEMLAAAWQQVSRLHENRVAHQTLDASRFLVESDGSMTITGLVSATVDADDRRLENDVAELLVSLAAMIGVERAAASADGLSDDVIERALPLVQPLALTTRTRRAAKKQTGLLDDVRHELAGRRGVDDVELAQIKRITFASVITLLGFLFLVAVAIEFIANWDEIADQLSEADYSNTSLILALTAFTYFAGAVSLRGAVMRTLALIPTTIVMLGQSFLNRFTPVNSGGMAMRIRYLQKGGTDVALATTAIGLTSGVNGIVQTVLIVLFALWAGTSPSSAMSSPDFSGLTYLIIGIIIIAAIVYFVPTLNQFVRTKVKDVVAKIGDEVGELARRPSKLTQLFGGNAASKFATISAFALSCYALDIDLGFAQLGFLYLVGSTVGGAVPAPGGIGPTEVALIAALTGAGVDKSSATAAVLLFRGLNYWAPVPFGYIALRYSRAKDLV